ncbi:MAG: penicillin binding protein PBP4B [Anaerococcus sp.]|nr:penicillin binding protein PBP4B [Peptoniphilaceae bacterium]MDY3054424.1 penicillin binding protein PBP4B [Anaerococcus sp.]
MKKYVILASALMCLLPVNSLAASEDVEDETFTEDDVYEYQMPLDIDQYDDSIITNTSHKFYFDKDSDDEFAVENIENADFYINGNKVDSEKEAKENIVDGKNTFDVLDAKDDVKVKIKSKAKETKTKSPSKKLDKKTTDLLETLLDEEVKENFSGGQITVIRDNKEVYNHNYGYKNNFYKDGSPIPVEKRDPVDKNTIFDLASNTKMYATNYALQKLVYEKKINLDDRVSKYFPDFKDRDYDLIKGKDDLRIRDILMHQAGFPADPQYHNEKYDKDDGIKNGKNDLYSQDRDKTIEMILKTPLQYEPGSKTIYSDVDYMLLGSIVEKVTGQRLDQYFNDNFAKPLGLHRTLFNPLENGFSKSDAAATELNGNTRDGAVEFNNIRTDTIQGQVHDEKAFYAMGGVSGHAGLFSTSTELAKLANIMLNNGRYKDYIFWDKKTQDEFIGPKESDPSYGLGWRRMADGRYGWAFSNLASSKAIGHTGWTGTLTVIDPVENLVLVLLTNKKNSPLLDNKKDPNAFYGDKSMAAGYGAVSTLIYKSLQENSDQMIVGLAKELKDGQARLLREGEDFVNEGELNDYIAIKNTYDIISAKYQNAENNDLGQETTDDNSEKTNKGINKSDNPKTGIGSVGLVSMVLLGSATLLEKTRKRKSC